ncbi:hypothetical protein M885DRAFT_16460 [Pelagophyceae sp. CCMP2097]|nr:hypothetical protein M885DRAFT_16460 [Pelagophyceae sp. CCMP2097]
MIIRVRATVATWRVEVSGPEASVQELMHAIALAKNVSVDCQSLSSDAAGKHVLSGASTLAQSGLGAPGSMVYLRVSGVELAPEGNLDAMDGMRGAPRRRIGADGAIVTAGYDEFTSAKGFRPGMSALRDMKKQWTLTQFLELDDQFNFPIKRQEKTPEPRRHGQTTSRAAPTWYRPPWRGLVYGPSTRTIEAGPSSMVPRVWSPETGPLHGPARRAALPTVSLRGPSRRAIRRALSNVPRYSPSLRARRLRALSTGPLYVPFYEISRQAPIRGLRDGPS